MLIISIFSHLYTCSVHIFQNLPTVFTPFLRVLLFPIVIESQCLKHYIINTVCSRQLLLQSEMCFNFVDMIVNRHIFQSFPFIYCVSNVFLLK